MSGKAFNFVCAKIDYCHLHQKCTLLQSEKESKRRKCNLKAITKNQLNRTQKEITMKNVPSVEWALWLRKVSLSIQKKNLYKFRILTGICEILCNCIRGPQKELKWNISPALKWLSFPIRWNAIERQIDFSDFPLEALETSENFSFVIAFNYFLSTERVSKRNLVGFPFFLFNRSL